MLDSIGCSVRIENGVMKVVKGELTVMKGVLSNGLYSLIGSTKYGITTSIVTKYQKDITNKTVIQSIPKLRNLWIKNGSKIVLKHICM